MSVNCNIIVKNLSYLKILVSPIRNLKIIEMTNIRKLKKALY